MIIAVTNAERGLPMHIAIALMSIFSAWKWGDWRHWQRYQPTMLYMLSAEMIYEFLTKDYSLWTFRPDILLNGTLVVLVYAVVSMPLTVLVFLSRYPQKWSKRILYYGKWVAIYMGVEVILSVTHRISYQHKWSLWWSFVFDVVMFPMLQLHTKKPLLAYVLSVMAISGYMIFLKVPITAQ